MSILTKFNDYIKDTYQKSVALLEESLKKELEIVKTIHEIIEEYQDDGFRFEIQVSFGHHYLDTNDIGLLELSRLEEWSNIETLSLINNMLIFLEENSNCKMTININITDNPNINPILLDFSASYYKKIKKSLNQRIGSLYSIKDQFENYDKAYNCVRYNFLRSDI